MLRLIVVTLMPEMFASLNFGITGRALKQQLVEISYINPRTWGLGPHLQVDDKPYGGGPGMVMRYEPLKAAMTEARKQLPETAKTVYLSPQGKLLKQAELNKLALEQQPLIFIAGRYEGIDERIIQQEVDEEWSIGDFVLSGGELAAMVYIDALTRLLPGSLGDAESSEQDSFMQQLLDHPHYTRPAEIAGLKVPEVLLKGNHQDIETWRRQQMLGQTWKKRPDLLKAAKVELSEADKTLLAAFIEAER